MEKSAAYLVDFDGTITDSDLTCELAAYFGGPAYLEVENQYRKREIPIRLWLEKIVSLLPPDMEELHKKALEWAGVRPGFLDFLNYASEQNSPVIVASDGLGYYIEPVLRKFGALAFVDLLYCNNTSINEKGTLEIITPHAHPICRVCGNCKANHVCDMKDEGRPVIYIGDGSNDRYGASWADHICAREGLAEHCRENSFSYTPWDDFHDIIMVEKPQFRDRSERSLCCPRGNGIKE
ncbi:MAG: MtnX-like HAD-IB family phosphatase [Bacillota bacterium]|nr:MtnX-like HAD-IB family phosphatase [Bacillota bacterium]